jgi:hypothetical protein
MSADICSDIEYRHTGPYDFRENINGGFFKAAIIVNSVINQLP